MKPSIATIALLTCGAFTVFGCSKNNGHGHGAGGMITAYAHLNSVLVKQGMIVRRGQPIGSVGSTGTVAHAQLHFEVRHGTDKLDPQEYLG